MNRKHALIVEGVGVGKPGVGPLVSTYESVEY